MTSRDDVYLHLRRFQIRMLLRKREAANLAGFLVPDESIIDMVKAFTVKVNGRRLAPQGFALVILTSSRVIVGAKTYHPIELTAITDLSTIERGVFRWSVRGDRWEFIHAKGLIHRNGNKSNTDRFYGSLARALSIL